MKYNKNLLVSQECPWNEASQTQCCMISEIIKKTPVFKSFYKSFMKFWQHYGVNFWIRLQSFNKVKSKNKNLFPLNFIKGFSFIWKIILENPIK